MRSFIIPGVLLAAALTAACSTTDSVAPTHAPATARRILAGGGSAPIRRAIDQYVLMSCDGGPAETIHVTGELRYSAELTIDGSGVSHLSIRSNTQGITGVGVTSGAFYRGLMTEHVTSRALDYVNEDVRTADIIRFVAPGSGGNSFSLTATSHFIVDQGDYVLWDQTFEEACR